MDPDPSRVSTQIRQVSESVNLKIRSLLGYQSVIYLNRDKEKRSLYRVTSPVSTITVEVGGIRKL